MSYTGQNILLDKMSYTGQNILQDQMFQSQKILHCFKFLRIFRQIDAVPRQIDVNNPVFSFGACVGIFRWSFPSNEFFPQTNVNFPRKKK